MISRPEDFLHSDGRFSRRDFLKLAALGSTALAMTPYKDILQGSTPSEVAMHFGYGKPIVEAVDPQSLAEGSSLKAAATELVGATRLALPEYVSDSESYDIITISLGIDRSALSQREEEHRANMPAHRIMTVALGPHGKMYVGGRSNYVGEWEAVSDSKAGLYQAEVKLLEFVGTQGPTTNTYWYGPKGKPPQFEIIEYSDETKGVRLFDYGASGSVGMVACDGTRNSPELATAQMTATPSTGLELVPPELPPEKLLEHMHLATLAAEYTNIHAGTAEVYGQNFNAILGVDAEGNGVPLAVEWKLGDKAAWLQYYAVGTNDQFVILKTPKSGDYLDVSSVSDVRVDSFVNWYKGQAESLLNSDESTVDESFQNAERIVVVMASEGDMPWVPGSLISTMPDGVTRLYTGSNKFGTQWHSAWFPDGSGDVVLMGFLSSEELSRDPEVIKQGYTDKYWISATLNVGVQNHYFWMYGRDEETVKVVNPFGDRLVSKLEGIGFEYAH